jgi:hypothetical protein
VAIERYGIVETLVKLEGIKSEHASKGLSVFFDLAGRGMNEEMKDLLMYAAITVARQNEDLKGLITRRDFSFRLMKEALGDYRILNLNVPSDLPEVDEHILRKKGMQIAAPIIENIRPGRIADFLERLQYLFPDILMGFHVRETIQHLTNVLEISGIKKDAYIDILTNLFSLGLIWNVHTIFWCENCRDQPLLLRTTSQLSPHHLEILCPRCEKPMSVSSIFRVHDLLRQCNVSQDGLLAVALAWLLRKNNVKYEASVHDEYEYDFVCRTPDGEVLIECKMHRRPSNERSFRGTLEKDLKQATDHFTTLKKKNPNLTRGYVLYNHDLEGYSATIDELSDKYGNVNLMNFLSLNDLIQEIKPT